MSDACVCESDAVDAFPCNAAVEVEGEKADSEAVDADGWSTE